MHKPHISTLEANFITRRAICKPQLMKLTRKVRTYSDFEGCIILALLA
jgi:hypothetical protein